MIKQPQITPSKAEKTRQHILSEGLLMATQKSLNDVTIGELAQAAGLSKSGLFAHFNSKENLQVAIVDYASEIFTQRVIRSVSETLSPIDRLIRLSKHWLNWYQGSARSCIFMTATMEFDGQPGIIRDTLHKQINRWIKYLENVTDSAINCGDLKPETSSQQFVFELYSLFLGSQKYYWIEKENENRTFFSKGFDHLIQQHSS